MTENVHVAQLSWPEYAKQLETSPIVFLPVGSLEQHGPHLPLHVDALLPTALAQSAAESIGGLVLPALSYGYHSMPRSGGGDKFPGTTNIAATTLMHLVRDVLLKQARHGVRKFCVLVGHFQPYDMFPEAPDWVPESGSLMSAKGASAAIGTRLADVVQKTLLAGLKREFG